MEERPNYGSGELSSDEPNLQVKELEGKLKDREDMIAVLEGLLEDAERRVTEAEQKTPAPVGDDSLRALAATVRDARRNGHPDANKHLDNLLSTILGS